MGIHERQVMDLEWGCVLGFVGPLLEGIILCTRKGAFSFCMASLQSFDAVAKVRLFSKVFISSKILAL